MNPPKKSGNPNLIKELETIRKRGYKIKDKKVKKAVGLFEYFKNSIIGLLIQVCNEYKVDLANLIRKYHTDKLLKNLPFFYTEYLFFKNLDESPQHILIYNDIYDIRSFSFAIPYCDFVAGENNAIALARRYNLNDLFSTILFNKSDFPDIVNFFKVDS